MIDFTEKFLQPIGGLLNKTIELQSPTEDMKYKVFAGSMGNLSVVVPSITSKVDGAGAGLSAEEARIKAVAETVERYASCIYSSEQMLWATANELGDSAIDLAAIPVCSPEELRNPKCPLIKPLKDMPMRWVRGVKLHNKKLVWVPANMVYLYMEPMSLAERQWLPISTGCSAHSTCEQALIGAICEVVERDAISITWLQKLKLPRLLLDRIPDWVKPHLESANYNNYKNYFFDATTDIGIPTVYSVQCTVYKLLHIILN